MRVLGEVFVFLGEKKYTVSRGRGGRGGTTSLGAFLKGFFFFPSSSNTAARRCAARHRAPLYAGRVGRRCSLLRAAGARRPTPARK